MALLYLFSPQTLIGIKTKSSLRRRIASLLSYGSQSSVSNEARDLMFMYGKYQGFRKEVDMLVSEACATCPP